MKMVQEKKGKSSNKVNIDDSILDIDEKDKEEETKDEDKSSGETKKINYTPDL